MKDLVLGAPASGSGHDSEADIAAVAFLTSVLIAISLIIEFVTHQLEHSDIFCGDVPISISVDSL